MVIIASIASDFATGVGLLAGMIAVTGFAAHARPALSGASEQEIRGATVVGGLVGLGLGAVVIVLSAFVSRVIA
jgi:hypothetical protein